MRETIWVVRDPQREVIGVGFNPTNALFNVVPGTDEATMRRFAAAVEQTGEDELHHNGYTLTRESLTPAAAGREVTEAMAMAALRSWSHHINANNATAVEAMTHAIQDALAAERGREG